MTFRANAVLPYDNFERATAGLRGRLRLMVAEHGTDLLPDWETLDVTGPTVTQDARGNAWFEWAATVRTKAPSTDSPPPS